MHIELLIELLPQVFALLALIERRKTLTSGNLCVLGSARLLFSHMGVSFQVLIVKFLTVMDFFRTVQVRNVEVYFRLR